MAAIPGQFQEHPDWSPNGKRLAFSVTDGNGTKDLWIADVDGSNAKRIVDCEAPCIWSDEPAWSPDGRSIAFQRTVVSGAARTSTLELYEVAADRSHVAATAPAGSTFYQPRWAPDGRRIVLELATNGPTVGDAPIADSIAIADLGVTPSTIRPLTKASLLGNSPDWRPNGDRIVYVLPLHPATDGFDGSCELATIAPDGSGQTLLTSLAQVSERALQPAYTPDGRSILFVREIPAQQTGVIAEIDVSGGEVRPATTSGWLSGVHPHLRPTR